MHVLARGHAGTGFLKPEISSPLINEANELVSIFVVTVKTLKAKKNVDNN